MATIEEAMKNHKSARTFVIKTEAKELYKGDRHHVPEKLWKAEIEDSWYSIGTETDRPKWVFIVKAR